MPALEHRSFFSGFAGAVAAMVLAAAVTAVADGDPATDTVPRVIPYEGVLELDGVPYSGAVDIEFSLYTAPDGEAVWTSVAENVPVYQGVFSVLLGEDSALTTTVLDATALFVGIRVSDDDGASWTPLAGRQQIGVTPYAMWSSNASNLDVAGELDVQGAMSLGDGDLTGGDTVLTLNLDQDWTFEQFGNGGNAGVRLGSNGGSGNLLFATDGEVQFRRGTSTTRVLTLDPVAGLTTAHEDLNVGNDLSAGRNLDVGNDLSVGRNLDVTGSLGAGPLTVDGATTLGGDVDLNGSLTATGSVRGFSLVGDAIVRSEGDLQAGANVAFNRNGATAVVLSTTTASAGTSCNNACRDNMPNDGACLSAHRQWSGAYSEVFGCGSDTNGRLCVCTYLQ